jgi:hypothetical protein
MVQIWLDQTQPPEPSELWFKLNEHMLGDYYADLYPAPDSITGDVKWDEYQTELDPNLYMPLAPDLGIGEGEAQHRRPASVDDLDFRNLDSWIFLPPGIIDTLPQQKYDDGNTSENITSTHSSTMVIYFHLLNLALWYFLFTGPPGQNRLARWIGYSGIYGFDLILVIFGTILLFPLSPSFSKKFVQLVVLSLVSKQWGRCSDDSWPSVFASKFSSMTPRDTFPAPLYCTPIIGDFVSAGTLAAATLIVYTRMCVLGTDFIWPFVIGVGLGVSPACLAIYFRQTIPETPRYNSDITIDWNSALRMHNIASAICMHNVVFSDTRIVGKDCYAIALETACGPTDRNSFVGPRTILSRLTQACISPTRVAFLAAAGQGLAMDFGFYSLNLRNPKTIASIWNDTGSKASTEFGINNSLISRFVLTYTQSLMSYWICTATLGFLGSRRVKALRSTRSVTRTVLNHIVAGTVLYPINQLRRWARGQWLCLSTSFYVFISSMADKAATPFSGHVAGLDLKM